MIGKTCAVCCVFLVWALSDAMEEEIGGGFLAVAARAVRVNSYYKQGM